jgi:two-component system nitrate/nitrite sensor histidine kinase NarX
MASESRRQQAAQRRMERSVNQRPCGTTVPEVIEADVVADGTRDLGAVLESFLATVVKLANAYAGAVRSLRHDGCTLRLVAAVGLPGEAVRAESIVGSCGVCGEAARGSGVRVAEDPSGCDKLALAAFFGKPRSGTVAVPLEYKGETVGVFTLFFEGVNQLRPEVINLLRPIGELLGLALENARLESEKLRASVAHERRAMAGEIHDSLAQSLTFMRMRMPLLADAIRRDERERALAYCTDVTDELALANRRLRELITHFRAGMDAPGLQRALADVVRSFRAQTGIELDFQSHVPGLALAPTHEVQVYHIVREALANVRKHSGARHASLRLAREGDHAVLTVEDDGTGVDAARPARRDDLPHFGLDIMRQRAKSIGASIDVARLASGGTRVRLTLPAGSVAQRSAG